MVTFRAHIYGPLDKGMVILQLCRWKFSHKKLSSRLHSIEVEFYSKNKKSLFEPPFGGLKCDLRTPSISRWKARGRLSVRHN